MVLRELHELLYANHLQQWLAPNKHHLDVTSVIIIVPNSIPITNAASTITNYSYY